MFPPYGHMITRILRIVNGGCKENARILRRYYMWISGKYTVQLFSGMAEHGF